MQSKVDKLPTHHCTHKSTPHADMHATLTGPFSSPSPSPSPPSPPPPPVSSRPGPAPPRIWFSASPRRTAWPMSSLEARPYEERVKERRKCGVSGCQKEKKNCSFSSPESGIRARRESRTDHPMVCMVSDWGSSLCNAVQLHEACCCKLRMLFRILLLLDIHHHDNY